MPRLSLLYWNEYSAHSDEPDASLIQPRGIFVVFFILTKLYSVRIPSLSCLGSFFVLKPQTSLIHSRISHLRVWCILIECTHGLHLTWNISSIFFSCRDTLMLGWGVMTYIFSELDVSQGHYAKSHFHIITNSDTWQPLTEPSQPQKMGATFCPLKSVVSDYRGEEDFWHSFVVSPGYVIPSIAITETRVLS